MQKFIRIALPWVYFAVMVWYLFFDGSNYLDLKWLVGVAGIGVVCYIGLYVKLHKLLQKQKEEHLCQLKKQAKQAEEAVAPELEKVKGNRLKKEMIKRRMVKEYLEKNTDYYANAYDNNAISKVQDWISSLWWSLYWLCLPFASIIIWVIVAILMALLFYWSFSTEMAICCAFSVAASIILVWRRHYVLAPIAIGLAVILLYGLLNAGLDGVEMRAYNMVLENEGIIFLSPSHAEDTMWGSMVILAITSICLALYPLLKKKNVGDLRDIGLTGCRSNTLQCSNEHDVLYSYIIFVLSICLVVCHQCRLSGYAWYFVQRCIYSDIRLLGMAVPRNLRSACFHKVVEGNGRT